MAANKIENKIKNFFRKKKEAAKFKLAGPGRRLNTDESSSSAGPSSSKPSKDAYVPPKRNELSAEARAAAEAAVQRTQQKVSTGFNTSLSAIRAQVKRELEAEKKEKEHENQPATAVEQTSELSPKNKNLAVDGVFFRCPLISDEILSRKEWKVKIKDFLYEQLPEERALTACLLIHNCNTKAKAELCIETLSKYLENIVQNPGEEKYRKIRVSNRIFCERVKPIEGGYDFLLGAGFTEQEIDDEQFLIYTEENPESINHLQDLLDALHNSEIINIDLDRNIQVLLPSQAKKYELPPDFYRMSPDEIKREQQLRSDAIESAQLLKTKAMREKDELRTMNKYNFALIRVRFPDGVFLQGTFSVYEKLSHIMEFVQSCLKDESFEFELLSPTGHKFSDTDINKSLYDLRLIPNSLCTFVYEKMLYPTGNYLKEDLLMLIQPV